MKHMWIIEERHHPDQRVVQYAWHFNTIIEVTAKLQSLLMAHPVRNYLIYRTDLSLPDQEGTNPLSLMADEELQAEADKGNLLAIAYLERN